MVNFFAFPGSHDEETQSIALSDTTARSRHAYIDDGHGTNLPPDLLAFSNRFPQSPSLQSSVSNIQDGRLYIKSPVSSPVYTNQGGYNGQMMTPHYRTLQHPKAGRQGMTMAGARANSPFTPAPIIYPPLLLKQGYVTIPRKPRVPSWTPSIHSTMSDFPPMSPTSIISGEIVEPVYDNLGIRTTASGNSSRNINKIGLNSPTKYSMKDRPLPATPSIGEHPKVYESIPETSPLMAPAINQFQTDSEPLYGGRQGTTPVINATGEKATKAPPRPPPKPKKRLSIDNNNELATTNNDGSEINGGGGQSSKEFQDEGEDGTEV